MTNTLLQALMDTDDDEVVDYAERILKVYGSAKPSVLDQEIERMAKLLGIPLEEI